jgi:predicted lipid-binding transport protein (Tim44 family)
MSDFLDLPTLIIIGVAVFVLLRLRSVLGTRTGNERKPSDRIRPPGETKTDVAKDDTIVPLRPNQPGGAPGAPNLDAERRARKLEAEIEQVSGDNKELAQGLMDIAEADGNFTPKSFLEGAKSAYEMIVTAYAEGDRRTLKNLLDKEVYDGFDAAIAERETMGHTVDFTFVGLPSIEISEASLDKRIANVTLRFKAEIVSATLDTEGNLVEGDREKVMTISDEWTFARQTKSRDPNWKLVATDQLD